MKSRNGILRAVSDPLDLSMDNVWEHRPIADQNGTLLANHNEDNKGTKGNDK